MRKIKITVLMGGKSPEYDVSPIIQWWVTPKLPRRHIFISPDKRPGEFGQYLRVYLRKWLIHPLKRRLAKYYLFALQNFFGTKVIGITGSAGKTTTKEMLASILRTCGETVYSYANIDPVYNIPSTILRCRPTTEYLVLEMGVEYPGEMDFYLWLAKPDIGIITNIYPAHTQYLGNVEGVYREKTKLVRGIRKCGGAILRREDAYLDRARVGPGIRVVRFGNGGNVRSSNERYTKDYKTKFSLIFADSLNSSYTVTLPILGKQFVSDALAAAACAIVLGVGKKNIVKGLNTFSPQEHRMQVSRLPGGAVLIDDSYNNNPEAAKEAIAVFTFLINRRKILVFGDMLELGGLEKRKHIELGKIIAESNIDYLIGVGPASRYLVQKAKRRLRRSSFWVPRAEQVLPLLRRLINNKSVILLKGSRTIGLDKIASELI